MKTLICSISIVFCIAGCESRNSIAKTDIVGTWVTTSNVAFDEESAGREVLIEEYFADGTFHAEGITEVYLYESGQLLFEMEGPERGRWSIESGMVKKVYESSEIRTFKSTNSFFTKEFLEELIANDITEPQWLIPLSISADELVFREQDEKPVYLMKRRVSPQSNATPPIE